jgi:tRNA-specific 2-thiouridylase
MSGGIDSSAAAILLLQQGYEVLGLTMKLWDEGSRCCSIEDVYNAKRVASQLRIPHYTINLREIFEQEVVERFVSEYLCGRTPNPCAVCNQKIKFGILLEKAKALGAQYIATGHYARIRRSNHKAQLIRGRDKNKDQSYFLSLLDQQSLRSALFPLGEYTKEEVKKIALKLGIKRKESQEVCFIPDGKYSTFIAKRVPIKDGPIVDKENKVIGRHKGIVNYTIGQRRGIGIPRDKPFYVIGIDANKNTIIVGEEEDLMHQALIVNHINWISGEKLREKIRCEVQVRYKFFPAKATIIPNNNREVLVIFDSPQKAITPGQLAVFYNKDTVLGGGWIKKIVSTPL